AVVVDPEKRAMIRRRAVDPSKVRTKNGAGAVYKTSLLGKILALMAMKAASLDPFGMGLEMEADKPGWCDSLNGLPGLFGSSMSESFELLRWARFLRRYLPVLLGDGDKLPVAREISEFMKAAGEALALARV